MCIAKANLVNQTENLQLLYFKFLQYVGDKNIYTTVGYNCCKDITKKFKLTDS